VLLEDKPTTKIVRIKLASHMVRVPGFVWRRVVAARARSMASWITFMTPDHHAVRNFVVLEIASGEKSVNQQQIAAALELPTDRVSEILDELERHMAFLWRDGAGNVRWAYPVTSDTTPHRIEYANAKPTYGA
jgi:hypothetical protein